VLAIRGATEDVSTGDIGQSAEDPVCPVLSLCC